MRRAGLRLALLAVLAGLVQIACALNPQPIPPWQDGDDDNAAEGSSSGGMAGTSGGDYGGSSGSGMPTTPPDDAGVIDSDASAADGDGGPRDAGVEEDAGDAGDAGAEDAGDAG